MLGDFELSLSLPAVRFAPELIAEGLRDPRFIEAFSQVLVVGESRCALRSDEFVDDFVASVKEAAWGIEAFFFRGELQPEMSCTRRVLAHQIRTFDVLLQSPRVVGYISKLHSCMETLKEETTRTKLTSTISTLSLFLLSGRRD